MIKSILTGILLLVAAIIVYITPAFDNKAKATTVLPGRDPWTLEATIYNPPNIKYINGLTSGSELIRKNTANWALQIPMTIKSEYREASTPQ